MVCNFLGTENLKGVLIIKKLFSLMFRQNRFLRSHYLLGVHAEIFMDEICLRFASK